MLDPDPRDAPAAASSPGPFGPHGFFERWTLTGERLGGLLERPEPPSPLPGILDPLPSLHLLVGEPKCGKTTLCATLAVAAAAGVPPWHGAGEQFVRLLGGRVLFLSAEQSAERVARTVARIAATLGITDNAWHKRFALLARDSWLPREGASMLRLRSTDEAGGIPRLRRLLADAQAEEDPIRLVAIDSLSRTKPEGAEENDNTAMSDWLGELATLSMDFHAYIVVIHHYGHEKKRARGASSLAAVAQATITFDRIDRHPRRRRLRVVGNAIPEHSVDFDVASSAEPERNVSYFLPVLSLEAELDLAMPMGVPMTEHAIAKAILRRRNPTMAGSSKPSGHLSRSVKEALDRYVGSVVEQLPGERGEWARRASFADAAPAAGKPSSGKDLSDPSREF